MASRAFPRPGLHFKWPAIRPIDCLDVIGISILTKPSQPLWSLSRRYVPHSSRPTSARSTTSKSDEEARSKNKSSGDSTRISFDNRMSALGGGSVLHSCLMAHGLLRALSARIIKWQGRDTSPNAARASSSSSFPGIPQSRSVEARHMSRSSGASLPRERRSSSADMSQMQIAMTQRYQARIRPWRSNLRKSHALKPKPDMNPTRFRKIEPTCAKQ